LEEATDDLGVSSVPNLMILYNPVLDTTDKGFGSDRIPLEKQTEISLCHQVTPGIVPTLLFHGTADTTVPFENAVRFDRLMKMAGNDCVLVPFEGKGHGFFNGSFFRARNGDDAFNETMEHSIGFLTKYGYIAAPLSLSMPSILSEKMVLQRGQPVPVWGTVDAGATVTVKFAGQEKSTVADADGAWRVDLDPLDASAQSRVLTVYASLGERRVTQNIEDVLVGEVWFAGGQSNMYRNFRMLTGAATDPKYEPVAEYLRKEAAEANDPLFRQYRTGVTYGPFTVEKIGRGRWSKAIQGEVNEFSGTGYFFCRELRRELDVPVAMICCNLGATRIEPWISPAAFAENKILKQDYDKEMAAYKERVAAWDEAAEKAAYQKELAAWKAAGEHGRGPRKPEHPSRDKQVYGTLYNGTVSPIIPYGIKGAIWYQGESNTGNFPEQYDIRLEALINGWREAWGQERLLFFWCQLANYKQPNAEPMGDEDGWPLVQDRMRRGLRIPDTGMAVLNDIGEAGDIHPKNKVDAGKRLSRWALNRAYGKELVVSGPLFKMARRDGARVVISFDHVGSGLMTGHKNLMDPTVEVDEPLKRFQICDASGDWKWAEAEIKGKDSVVVWHREIKKPTEVRYAWSPNPEGANLYNKEGLPASVFTTDVLK
uniref:sialate O-acetylesterase n=1 Tax=Pontiella sp. TaxID=2837462 RepID=UPI00356B230E